MSRFHGKTISVCDFWLGQKNLNCERSLSSPLSWEQRKNQMDAVCCPLFPAAACSSNIFSHFLDLFDMFGSPNPPPPPTLISHPAPSSLPLPCPLLPPLLLCRRGVPAEDHCLRSEGPLIAALGVRGGVDRINPTDPNIWLPLCLMTMLAFHMQPNRLDQICSIDLDARADRAQATRTHVYHSTVHITQIHRECPPHTYKYTHISLKNTIKDVIKYHNGKILTMAYTRTF